MFALPNALTILRIVLVPIFAIAFVRIYLRGREDKPWLGQGLRYGMTMAALTVDSAVQRSYLTL